jgi:hypothetical protein
MYIVTDNKIKILQNRIKALKAGLGSRVFLAPWSRSRLEKQSVAGAGASKKLAGSSALLEDKKQ